jgi:flagellar export protein FliJ
MRAFNFRLATLLRLREASREKSLLDYAKSIHERQQTEDRLKRASKYVETLEFKLSEKQKLSFNANELEALIGGLDHARSVVTNLSTELSRKKTLEESRRKLFVKKDSESKSLGRLKDRQMNEHIQMEAKKEELELDDVIGARYLYERSNPVITIQFSSLALK